MLKSSIKGNTRCILNEGMPMYRNPYEKGNLYIKFDIKFPESHELTEEAIKVSDALPKTRCHVKRK